MGAILLHLERLWQDVRHGARVFARNPALTAIAVLSIACGTGANVAMFSVADAMLLRPLPVTQPDTLLAVGFKVEAGNGMELSRASYLDCRDLRERARSFEGIAAYDYETVGLSVRAGDPARVRFATFVSDTFFHRARRAAAAWPCIRAGRSGPRGAGSRRDPERCALARGFQR